jgi:nicotinate-nucleotide--dimethylbenzimidazole phosphoribosyltransferase
MSGLLENTIDHIKPLDEIAMRAAQERQNMLTKPTGSLGKLEELSIKIAGIQGKALPEINKKAVIVMAADHGVVEEGISAYPQEVTAQMVLNFVKGGAAINAIGRETGSRVVVVNIGVKGNNEFKDVLNRKIADGTQNIAAGPAMTIEQARQSIETGIEVINAECEKGLDIAATGEMGIGNTTASSAICAIMTGKAAAAVTGKGTGLGSKQLFNKISVINKALSVNRPDTSNPVETLAKIGGFEIGGLAGVMLGAAAKHVPVMIDGFISGAAALIAVGLCPRIKDYLIAGHLSLEPGHKSIIEYLNIEPLLDLNMRLGEGTGAALGISIAAAACRTLSEMATFAEAGVSDKGG